MLATGHRPAGASPSHIERVRLLNLKAGHEGLDRAGFHYQLAGLLLELEEIKVLLDLSGDAREGIVDRILKKKGHNIELLSGIEEKINKMTLSERALMYSFIVRASDILAHRDS